MGELKMSMSDAEKFMKLMAWCWQLEISVELSDVKTAVPSGGHRRYPVLRFSRGNRSRDFTRPDFDDLFKAVEWSSVEIARDLVVPPLVF